MMMAVMTSVELSLDTLVSLQQVLGQSVETVGTAREMPMRPVMMGLKILKAATLHVQTLLRPGLVKEAHEHLPMSVNQSVETALWLDPRSVMIRMMLTMISVQINAKNRIQRSLKRLKRMFKNSLHQFKL